MGGTNFKDADLAGLELYGNPPGNTNFEGANLTGATLIGNFLSDKFKGANLTGVKYCDATIEGVAQTGGCPGTYYP